MERLAPSDVRLLLDFVHDLGSDDEAPAPQVVLDRLVELIPCVNAVRFDGGEGVVRAGELEFPAAVVEASDEFGAERPTSQRRLTPADGAVRLSARMRRPELRRLTFYQLAMRPFGIEDELMVLLPIERPAIVGFSLLKDSPFTERERTMLELLAPYLARAARPGWPELTAREREVLGWVARGNTNKEIAAILGVTPATVRKHLENAFEELGVHTRTAAVAKVNGAGA